MKGISIFSDVFLLFALLAITILMVTFIYIMWLTYGVESLSGLTQTRKVALNLFFKPVKYDSVFLSFLELTNNGIPMKTLLEEVLIQNSTNVWIKGEYIDVSSVSSNFLQKLIDKPYILKLTNPEIIVAQSGYSKSYQKITTKLFSVDGSEHSLEFYVG